MTTVQEIIWEIEEIKSFLDDLTKPGSVRLEDSDATRLSDILVRYRDILMTMKVKTN